METWRMTSRCHRGKLVCEPMKLVILIVILVFLIYGCSNPKPKTQAADFNDVATSPFYREQHRPQFHFSPDSMWMNDPNGMVYYEGEYHLFFQHYPDSTVWGPMHWGHAVSTDLVHWQQLPIALYPDSLGYIFSGSAVVDWKNSSGFGTDQNPPLVAIFTYHNDVMREKGALNFQTQAIAYSNDKGRTWIKYEGNPVIDNPGIKDFRDPKVIWHEASQKWVMVFAVLDHVKIYNSENLKEWQLVSEFGRYHGSHGGVWECPDLFPLEVENTGETKWVMIVSLGDGAPNGGSGTQYFIGDFDGKRFVNSLPPDEVLWLDYGRDNYAGVTWSDIPEDDGRRIFIGWMSNWKYAGVVPTEPWRSAMTIPRTLSLVQLPIGIRLITQPVEELRELRNRSFEIKEKAIKGDLDVHLPFDISRSEVLLEFADLSMARDFGIMLSNRLGQQLRVGYDPAGDRFYIDRSSGGAVDFSDTFADKQYAPRLSKQYGIKLHLLFDVSSVELFTDDGQVAMTAIYFPDQAFNQVKLYANDGSVGLNSARFFQLNSIWQNRL